MPHASSQPCPPNRGKANYLEATMLREIIMVKLANKLEATPAGQGFSMPAEWETHEATWLAWPHKLNTIRWVYGEVKTCSEGVATIK